MILSAHTYYSYKFGTLGVRQLLDEALVKGYDTVALTDVNSTSAVLDFVRLSKEAGLHTVVGIDFRNGAQQRYLALARNNAGFREINEHLTQYSKEEREFEAEAPAFENAYVVYPLGSVRFDRLRENEFIGVRPSQVTKLIFSDWKKWTHKLVALQTLSFRHKRDFNAHRLLRAIANNTLLSKLPVTEQAQPDEVLLPVDDFLKAYEACPILIENTVRLLQECSIHFDYKKSKNKKCFTASHDEDIALMRSECEKGLLYRYGKAPTNVIERMEKELKLIDDFGFCSYFLINWDMLRHARSKNYYYVGRGSGANSMVAYLLRITDVDPIELDLYFERFINPYRTNPPDFDIDFSSLNRDEMTKYLFDTHGWDKCALVGAYSTFQRAAVTRELGKVFGLPAAEIDQLQELRDPLQADEMGRLVWRYSQYIEGFPSHLTVHSSGVIISEEPISCYSATMMPPKGFPTVHFSMLESEDVGLYKFDILGQRGLGKIKDSLELVQQNKGIDLDVHDMRTFKDDDRIKSLLREGNAIGCFYVESPAMRMLLTKLKADDYLRLVAASSIIRPGVAKSGMMQEYILRFQDEKRREKAQKEIPELYAILHETFGVMVYQEDVIKVAHYFAGLSLSESDVLRRGMSWKFRERTQFDSVKDKFFSNCKEKGHSDQTVQDIWTQIESFANYAFSKGHSASYAVESYQALYIKAYYPHEYMVATVNNGGGFYRTELYLHEARMHGAEVQLPCVNHSEGLCTIEDEVIYLGLGFINEVKNETINAIIPERARNGAYKDLLEFTKRVPVSLEQLRLLIRAGCFRFTGKSKKELLWDAHLLLGDQKKTKPAKELFDLEVKEWKIPALWKHELEDAYDELELFGFVVTTTPFHLLEYIPALPIRAKDLRKYIGYTVALNGYLVHRKRTQTSKGEMMCFATWLDMDGQWIDTVHFPPALRDHPFQGPGCYVVQGKVIEEYGFVSIDISYMERIPMKSMDNASTRLKRA